MRDALEGAELLPGVQSTLQFLRSHSVSMGIISSAVHHSFLDWALERFNVADAFDVVVSSARAGFYKSRREIYDYALDALGARADRSVHVGDSYRFDHLAARELGLATVWIRETRAVPGQNGSQPDLELATLEGAGPEILALLQNRPGQSSAD
jgi:FMN phosphatase YigB (HAD superfamily)